MKIRIAFLSLIFSCLTLLACRGSEIIIQHDRYSPLFSFSEYSKYKGKSIYLPSFENRAANTTIAWYHSPDRSITYLAQYSTLESFYWYCFLTSFRSIGMGVYEHGYPLGTMGFHLTIMSLNDQEFKYRVILLKDGFQIFEKNYIVNMPPAQTGDRAQLEKRAYELTDLAITTVLKDPDFSKNF